MTQCLAVEQKWIGLQCLLQSFADCPSAGRPYGKVVPKWYLAASG